MASGIPWTAVINYGFYGYCLPKLGALGPPPVPETATVYEGGNVKGRQPSLDANQIRVQSQARMPQHH